MRRWSRLLLLVLSAGCAQPETLEALLAEGEAAEARGDGEAACACYARAAEAFPDFAEAWSYYGESLRFWRHKADAAREAFERALKAPRADDRALAFSWRGLGEIRREALDVTGALRCFEKSLAILPLADTHRSLSALYATEKRDFARAAEHARAALALSPDDPIARIQCAVQLLRLGSPEEAQALFEAGMKGGPPLHCCVLYNGACYLAVRGDQAGALDLLERFFLTHSHRHLTRQDVLRDPDFAPLLADPGFRALLDRHLPPE